jgi:hypothetical protein
MRTVDVSVGTRVAPYEIVGPRGAGGGMALEAALEKGRVHRDLEVAKLERSTPALLLPSCQTSDS